MLELLIVILLVLWLLGFFGPRYSPRIPRNDIVHVLLIIVLVLLIIRLI